MNGTEIAIGEAVGLAVAARAALDRGDLAAARADARAAAAMLREHAGAGSADVANVLVLQADAERLLGELAAAEVVMQRRGLHAAGPRGGLGNLQRPGVIARGGGEVAGVLAHQAKPVQHPRGI